MKILRKDLLDLRGLTAGQVQSLLDLSRAALQGALPAGALQGRVVAMLFFESSTRTRTSFELAARRLGAEVVAFDVARSSVQKGESLLDTARTLEAMGVDAIVLRHGSSGAPHFVARHVHCSVINAGDGMHEHPTQGLLDLLTVREIKGRIAGLRVVILGDILHSRVARSTAYGLGLLGARVVLCGPTTLLPPSLDIPNATMTVRIEEALEEADVVIPLRMQLERAAAAFVPSLGEFARLYALTPQRLCRARPDAIVMHPGPMNLGVEITPEVAYGPQSVVLRQVAHGVAVRMAVLYDLLAAPPAHPELRPVAQRVAAGVS
ncbi:MAG: aspartate carbamoyltransferase catalytic subunit [Armatimonadota bacterium]|nr:aspartate carbamoyltransferase catalytic subunit [Armatimonadota bacterium]MDR7440114.1 aspartate carbamoyltransferase catalytic subunit [Armatimonadota bacterium]MDR7562387.1 aspartate carbamoyltransferase catalytic subunit [Armatimonadota bacterium]MDR7567066.1 aspartate carbamoyltransferase catalytic subunit [Armatimonadota bacterium]MDR7601531.1 aspartate carbamoyltransferase catalytic subunit [Armatimonadota bacterium]